MRSEDINHPQKDVIFFCFYKCKVAILKKNTFGEGVKIRHVQSYLKLSKKY